LGHRSAGRRRGAQGKTRQRGGRCAPARARPPSDMGRCDHGECRRLWRRALRGSPAQQAELALDKALSGVWGSNATDERRLVITQHTRRGTLHADVGDISFFPWDDGRNGSKAVAVAGLGRPGTFDTVGLRRLVSGLVVAATALPMADTLCAVLVGRGEGTLTTAQAVRGWLDGIS